jgi:hypothetical protein
MLAVSGELMNAEKLWEMEGKPAALRIRQRSEKFRSWSIVRVQTPIELSKNEAEREFCS